MIYLTQKKLIEWFQINKRDMPWRNNPSPYRVWISEVMLQQTTVATVCDYFINFMERFPNLEILSQAKEEEVLLLWAGLGYYSRAKNILKTAKIIGSEKNFPSNLNELKKLPGIGDYTAAAITSIAYNIPDYLIDTNVDRVLGRVYALNRQENDFKKKLSNYASDLIDRIYNKQSESIFIWNQALMEIGALICKVNQVNCEQCPLNDDCLAFKSANPLVYPGKKLKIKLNHKIEYTKVIKNQNNIVLTKINNQKRRQGLYDFISCSNLDIDIFYQFSYRISNDKVTRYVYLFEDKGYQLKENEVFVDINNVFDKYPVISPCKKIIKKLI